MKLLHVPKPSSGALSIASCPAPQGRVPLGLLWLSAVPWRWGIARQGEISTILGLKVQRDSKRKRVWLS